MSVFNILLALCLTSSVSYSYPQGDLSTSLTQSDKWLLSGITANDQVVPDLRTVEFESLPVPGKERIEFDYQQSSCQLVQIVHLLQQSGCQTKAIASFACLGSCQSYVQVSNPKAQRALSA